MGIHYTTLGVDTADLAADAVTSAKVADNLVQYAAVELGTADIAALQATPYPLVAAAGAGKVIEFIAAQMAYDAGSPATAYTVTGVDDLGIYYGDANGSLLSTEQDATAILDTAGTADSITLFDKKEQCVTGVANTPIVLAVSGTGTPADGNGTMHIKVAYRVYETGL